MGFHMSNITKGFHRVRPKWFLSLWYVWRKPYTNLAPTLRLFQTDRNKIPRDTHHLPLSGVSKMIFEPMVHSAQIVHLSCVKICTISKRTETSIHLSLVTLEYHQVHLKWFLSLWYIWHKLRTYLALTPTLSPNKLKRDFQWPTSPRKSIGCV
jgi:hypothetical protein